MCAVMQRAHNLLLTCIAVTACIRLSVAQLNDDPVVGAARGNPAVRWFPTPESFAGIAEASGFNKSDPLYVMAGPIHLLHADGMNLTGFPECATVGTLVNGVTYPSSRCLLVLGSQVYHNNSAGKRPDGKVQRGKESIRTNTGMVWLTKDAGATVHELVSRCTVPPWYTVADILNSSCTEAKLLRTFAGVLTHEERINGVLHKAVCMVGGFLKPPRPSFIPIWATSSVLCSFDGSNWIAQQDLPTVAIGPTVVSYQEAMFVIGGHRESLHNSSILRAEIVPCAAGESVAPHPACPPGAGWRIAGWTVALEHMPFTSRMQMGYYVQPGRLPAYEYVGTTGINGTARLLLAGGYTLEEYYMWMSDIWMVGNISNVDTWKQLTTAVPDAQCGRVIDSRLDNGGYFFSPIRGNITKTTVGNHNGLPGDPLTSPSFLFFSGECAFGSYDSGYTFQRLASYEHSSRFSTQWGPHRLRKDSPSTQFALLYDETNTVSILVTHMFTMQVGRAFFRACVDCPAKAGVGFAGCGERDPYHSLCQPCVQCNNGSLYDPLLPCDYSANGIGGAGACRSCVTCPPGSSPVNVCNGTVDTYCILDNPPLPSYQLRSLISVDGRLGGLMAGLLLLAAGLIGSRVHLHYYTPLPPLPKGTNATREVQDAQRYFNVQKDILAAVSVMCSITQWSLAAFVYAAMRETEAAFDAGSKGVCGYRYNAEDIMPYVKSTTSAARMLVYPVLAVHAVLLLAYVVLLRGLWRERMRSVQPRIERLALYALLTTAALTHANALLAWEYLAPAKTSTMMAVPSPERRNSEKTAQRVLPFARASSFLAVDLPMMVMGVVACLCSSTCTTLAPALPISALLVLFTAYAMVNVMQVCSRCCLRTVGLRPEAEVAPLTWMFPTMYVPKRMRPYERTAEVLIASPLEVREAMHNKLRSLGNADPAVPGTELQLSQLAMPAKQGAATAAAPSVSAMEPPPAPLFTAPPPPGGVSDVTAAEGDVGSTAANATAESPEELLPRGARAAQLARGRIPVPAKGRPASASSLSASVPTTASTSSTTSTSAVTAISSSSDPHSVRSLSPTVGAMSRSESAHVVNNPYSPVRVPPIKLVPTVPGLKDRVALAGSAGRDHNSADDDNGSITLVASPLNSARAAAAAAAHSKQRNKDVRAPSSPMAAIANPVGERRIRKPLTAFAPAEVADSDAYSISSADTDRGSRNRAVAPGVRLSSNLSPRQLPGDVHDDADADAGELHGAEGGLYGAVTDGGLALAAREEL